MKMGPRVVTQKSPIRRENGHGSFGFDGAPTLVFGSKSGFLGAGGPLSAGKATKTT